MVKELNLEQVQKLFYDESNGFGSRHLKAAHDKFVDATASMILLGGAHAEMAGEDDIEFTDFPAADMVENLLMAYMDNRGLACFYKAAQKLGLIQDISEINLKKPGDDDIAAYGDDKFNYTSALARSINDRIERRVEAIRSGKDQQAL